MVNEWYSTHLTGDHCDGIDLRFYIKYYEAQVVPRDRRYTDGLVRQIHNTPHPTTCLPTWWKDNLKINYRVRCCHGPGVTNVGIRVGPLTVSYFFHFLLGPSSTVVVHLIPLARDLVRSSIAFLLPLNVSRFSQSNLWYFELSDSSLVILSRNGSRTSSMAPGSSKAAGPLGSEHLGMGSSCGCVVLGSHLAQTCNLWSWPAGAPAWLDMTAPSWQVFKGENLGQHLEGGRPGHRRLPPLHHWRCCHRLTGLEGLNPLFQSSFPIWGSRLLVVGLRLWGGLHRTLELPPRQAGGAVGLHFWGGLCSGRTLGLPPSRAGGAVGLHLWATLYRSRTLGLPPNRAGGAVSLHLWGRLCSGRTLGLPPSRAGRVVGLHLFAGSAVAGHRLPPCRAGRAVGFPLLGGLWGGRALDLLPSQAWGAVGIPLQDEFCSGRTSDLLPSQAWGAVGIPL